MEAHRRTGLRSFYFKRLAETLVVIPAVYWVLEGCPLQHTITAHRQIRLRDLNKDIRLDCAPLNCRQ